jgi:hypothetical protein
VEVRPLEHARLHRLVHVAQARLEPDDAEGLLGRAVGRVADLVLGALRRAQETVRRALRRVEQLLVCPEGARMRLPLVRQPVAAQSAALLEELRLSPSRTSEWKRALHLPISSGLSPSRSPIAL